MCPGGCSTLCLTSSRILYEIKISCVHHHLCASIELFKKLSFLTDLISEKTKFNNQFEVLTSSRSGLFRQSEYFNKRVTSANNSGYGIIAPGQFTFRAMSDDGTFKFNRSTYSFKGIVSPAYEVFEAKNCSPDFLDYVLNSDEFHKKIYGNAQGGTRLVLKYSSLSKLILIIPPLQEQKKIAKK